MTTPTSIPLRDDSGTTSTHIGQGAPPPSACPTCTTPFTATGRQRYCSTACRKTAFRRRHQQDQQPVVVPPPARRRHTVYQCGSCDTRLLGQQRCADCNVFGTALGLGGTCPCCDEIITLADLDLTT